MAKPTNLSTYTLGRVRQLNERIDRTIDLAEGVNPFKVYRGEDMDEFIKNYSSNGTRSRSSDTRRKRSVVIPALATAGTLAAAGTGAAYLRGRGVVQHSKLFSGSGNMVPLAPGILKSARKMGVKDTLRAGSFALKGDALKVGKKVQEAAVRGAMSSRGAVNSIGRNLLRRVGR